MTKLPRRRLSPSLTCCQIRPIPVYTTILTHLTGNSAGRSTDSCANPGHGFAGSQSPADCFAVKAGESGVGDWHTGRSLPVALDSGEEADKQRRRLPMGTHSLSTTTRAKRPVFTRPGTRTIVGCLPSPCPLISPLPTTQAVSMLAFKLERMSCMSSVGFKRTMPMMTVGRRRGKLGHPGISKSADRLASDRRRTCARV